MTGFFFPLFYFLTQVTRNTFLDLFFEWWWQEINFSLGLFLSECDRSHLSPLGLLFYWRWWETLFMLPYFWVNVTGNICFLLAYYFVWRCQEIFLSLVYFWAKMSPWPILWVTVTESTFISWVIVLSEGAKKHTCLSLGLGIYS